MAEKRFTVTDMSFLHILNYTRDENHHFLYTQTV